jgi:hypothetical protein
MITIQTNVRIDAMHNFIEVKDVPPGNYKVTMNLEEEKKGTENAKKKPRKAGMGKDLIAFISDNFNAPMDDFKDYM